MVSVFQFDSVSALFVLFFIVLLTIVMRKDEKRILIDKLPGPLAYPFLGNIMEVLDPPKKLVEKVTKRREKFGPIFRLWLGTHPIVILSRAEEIEVVLKSSKHSQKSITYNFLKSWLGTGLLTAHGDKWATHRKLITPTFHFSILQNFIEIFLENSNILIENLKKKAETGEVFNISPLVTLCALDIICETAMGTKIHAQLNNQNQYVKSVYQLSALTVRRINRIWLHPTSLFRISPSGREYFKHLKIVHDFTENVIKMRKEALNRETSAAKENGKMSFLDLLLKANTNECITPLTDEELREEVNTFMFEGHDTSATSINWTLFLLGHHSDIQTNVYEEIKAIYDSKKGEKLTIADLGNMKLLERVIKESLRLFPSVFSIGRTTEEDLKLGNYLIPKGVTVVVAIYTIHRDPEYYKNPNVFDPDRFLPENSAGRHPYAYVPFSAGPRNCIGQKFAMYEEKVILSNLLYRYRFESTDKLEEIYKLPELILRPHPGINLKVYKR